MPCSAGPSSLVYSFQSASSHIFDEKFLQECHNGIMRTKLGLHKFLCLDFMFLMWVSIQKPCKLVLDSPPQYDFLKD